MNPTMTKDRSGAIHDRAEDLAIHLINNGLVSDNPGLDELCQKLERFRPLLLGKDVNETQARTLLRNGFRLVRLEPDPAATDEAEVLRLLHGLAAKLGGMTSMLGGLLKGF